MSDHRHLPEKQLDYSPDRGPRLSHYAFRYPAKFHPPVARKLVEQFSVPGQVCFDPFCGSGTLLVEAAAAGRQAIGSDVDPLAVFISTVKCIRHDMVKLKSAIQPVLVAVDNLRNLDAELAEDLLHDISIAAFDHRLQGEGLWLPDIPRLHHWFRRAVLVQLSRLSKLVLSCKATPSQRAFLRLCLASVIRKCSNADPTPVSGLEVTAHMRRLEAAGRQIDVLKSFEDAIGAAIKGAEEYSDVVPAGTVIRTRAVDARSLARSKIKADVVITSPPYHNAVDYYRRHQLEMYWLGLTVSQADRLLLLDGYIGRANTAKRLMPKKIGKLPAMAAEWDAKIRSQAPRRADDFVHYFTSMQKVFSGMAHVLDLGAKAVIVVGNSRFGDEEIPTDLLFEDLAGNNFRHRETFWYPVKNRYMSYSRRNGANINREHVLVFERT